MAVVITSASAWPVKQVTSCDYWFCNLCKARAGRASARYRCYLCADFDLCAQCRGILTSKAPHEHKLVKVAFAADGSWKCNVCKHVELGSTRERYCCCRYQNFDICSECLKKNHTIDSTFALKVKTLTGKSIDISVHPHMTTLQMKELVQEKEGIPLDQMKLIFAGLEMLHERTVADYNIHPNDVIHLVLHLRG